MVQGRHDLTPRDQWRTRGGTGRCDWSRACDAESRADERRDRYRSGVASPASVAYVTAIGDSD
jgi:hypothetical protein